MVAPTIIVVGGGIVGGTVAMRLAQRGAHVTLVEAGAVGNGTTASSFAWIDASDASLEPYLELSVAGVAAWRELGTELGDPPWLALTGTLTWETAPSPASALAHHIDRLQGLGHAARALSRVEVAHLEPDLVVDSDATVWSFPDEGYLQPVAALGDVLALGCDAGLTVRESTRVTGFMEHGGRITGVELDAGDRLAADVVISCVGRDTEMLLALADVTVPMTPAKPTGSAAVGLLVLTTPVPARLRRVVVADGLMVRPDGAGRLLLHANDADARVGADTVMVPPPALAGELVGRVRARLRHTSAATVESARIGVRALPADRRPIVGRARPGLYVIATHSGVTLAPLLARLATHEVIDFQQSVALTDFRPARFEEAP